MIINKGFELYDDSDGKGIYIKIDGKPNNIYISEEEYDKVITGLSVSFNENQTEIIDIK